MREDVETAHAAGFYEDAAGLARAAGRFLADGLRQGETALVLALPEHAEAVAAAVGRHERLRFLDAGETFGRICPGGVPDAEAFERVVGEALSQAGPRPRVLWTSGSPETALRLEALWTGLQRKRPFRLLCAYDLSRLEAEPLGRVGEAHAQSFFSRNPQQLQEAVDGAFDEVLGPERAGALRRLVAASLRPAGPRAPWAKMLFWGLSRLPGKGEAMLQALRRRLEGKAADVAPAAPGVERLRILYAEDDENDVFFLRHAASKVAPEVELSVAPDGDAARGMLGGAGPRPDLLLLDLKLPKRNGLEVLQWVKAEPALAGIPTVVLTSSTERSDIEKAQQGGADLYLAKQADLTALAELVRGLAAYAAAARARE